MIKKVLLMVDCQTDFVDGALGNEETKKIVDPVVSLIKNGKFDLILATFDEHGDDYLQTQEGKKLPVPHCIKGTAGWRLNPSIGEALESAGIKTVKAIKHTFGTFDFVNLEDLHDGCDLEFHIVGLCTDICVVSNVLILKAAFPEARFIVHQNACAGVTPESHQAALTTMKSCQIEVE